MKWSCDRIRTMTNKDKKESWIRSLKTSGKLAIIVSSWIILYLVIHHAGSNVWLMLAASAYGILGVIVLIVLIGEYSVRFIHWLERHVSVIKKLSDSMSQSNKLKGRTTRTVYFLVRALTVLTAIRQFQEGAFFYVFLCILSLVLFTLPDLISHRFAIRLPDTLETIIYLFIFAAEILGEINNFYNLIPFWDTMLHTLNGFLCAAIGFSMVDLLNRNSERINLSPFYLATMAFCFSMTIGVIWEFIEHTADMVFKTDMQKDTWIHEISSVSLNPEGANDPVIIKNIDHTEVIDKDGKAYVLKDGYLDIGLQDTMDDLFVNFIGAIVFSAFGYFYVKNRDQNSFVTKLIPVSEKQDK